MYNGNGGFTIADVYELPIFLRRYYIKLANEAVQERAAKQEEAMKKRNKGSETYDIREAAKLPGAQQFMGLKKPSK